MAVERRLPFGLNESFDAKHDLVEAPLHGPIDHELLQRPA